MNERIKEHDLHKQLSPTQTSTILEHPFYDHVSCLDYIFFFPNGRLSICPNDQNKFLYS